MNLVVSVASVYFNEFRKKRKTRLKFSQGNITVLWKMANNEEVRVKLTNTQLNKLKFAAKIKTERTPRITKKIS